MAWRHRGWLQGAPEQLRGTVRIQLLGAARDTQQRSQPGAGPEGTRHRGAERGTLLLAVVRGNPGALDRDTPGALDLGTPGGLDRGTPGGLDRDILAVLDRGTPGVLALGSLGGLDRGTLGKVGQGIRGQGAVRDIQRREGNLRETFERGIHQGQWEDTHPLEVGGSHEGSQGTRELGAVQQREVAVGTLNRAELG